MENIQEKYKRLRSSIKQGDTILFHGTGIIAKIIQEGDNDAYFNHIGIVVEIAGVLYIIDSNAPGVHPERLSVRIAKYAAGDGDFVIKRSQKTVKQITTALYNVQQTLEQQGTVSYDFINGAKSLSNRYFKTQFKIKPKANAMICSMFVYPYQLELDMIYPRSFEKTLFFPQDSIRFEKNTINII